MNGRFITFEGGEGAGKSTQIRRLADLLRRAGLDPLVTREPGGSPGAEAIRSLLLSGAIKPFGALAETVMFSAARIDHLDATIRPALTAGRWVLCDRFMDSTRAYQGVLGDIEPGVIAALESVVVEETRPDLTVILDLPPEVGLARAAGRGAAPDRFEAEGLTFHTRLRETFRAIAQAEPGRCVVVDASGSADAVAAKILHAVVDRLGREKTL